MNPNLASPLWARCPVGLKRVTWIGWIAALTACGAIQDQSFSCTGFDEQDTALTQDATANTHRRIHQNIALHIRNSHVMVKSFRADRLAADPPNDQRVRFALQASEAHMRGSFDPANGVLSYDESHHTTIDQQEHVTQITGLYRCTPR